MAEPRRTQSRVLAERDSAGVRVRLVWLEGTPDVWLELQEPTLEHPLVVAVEPARALDAFRHPFVYASRALAVEPLAA